METIEEKIQEAFPPLSPEEEAAELERAKEDLNNWLNYIRDFIQMAEENGEEMSSYQAEIEELESQLAEANNWETLEPLFEKLDQIENDLLQIYAL